MIAPVSAKFRRFRDVWKFLVPGWLQSGDGEKVQWLEGLLIDAFIERCHQAAKLMLPSVAVSDALDRIGSDRAIPRGFAEPEASYRERLIRWRYPRGHRIRGNAPGLLEQIAAVFGHGPLSGATTLDYLYTIDARGTLYPYEGAVARAQPWNWDGSALLPNWARFWIVLRPTGVAPWPAIDSGAWGPSVDNPNVCHDMQGVHPGQIQAVRTLCQVGRRSWTPAGRRPMFLIIGVSTGSLPVPTGNWNTTANRPLTYGFVHLHPEA